MNGKPLEISTHRDGRSVSIVLEGELDQASADRLDVAIRLAEGPESEQIVVDLSEVAFIDSTGLSVLLEARKRSNGRFSVLPSKSDSVTRLLELTGTSEILSDQSGA
jgi:anti-anti-sigma factor